MNSPASLRRLISGLLLTAFSFSVRPVPGQALPELTIEGVPGNERIKLSWPDNGEVLKLDYSGDVGTRAAWAPVPDVPGLSGGIFSVQYDVGNTGGFWRLRRPDLVPPVFPQPSGTPAVTLGNVTRLRLAATDLGGAVTYSIEPNPLPEGAHLDENGVLTFRPVEGMAGDYPLTITATDIWGNSTVRNVTLTVNLPPAGTPTSFTGLAIDLDATAGGGFVPVVNAKVALLGTAHAAFTDETGRFTLSGVPGGLQVLDISTAEAEPGPGGAKYAFFRENYRLIPGVANVDDRPFYLPRLDESSMTTVVPGLSTGVVNPTLNIAMTVGANTAVTDDGSAFGGELSITRVPEELAPAKLPDELGQTSLITIQPVGVTFTTPAPITFPNTDNLPPGEGTDLWSLDPKSGSWVIVGTGRVTPDGQWIETVSGGIRAAEWHAVMPPQPCPENGGDDPEHHDPDDNCNGNSGSEVSLHTGGLRTMVALPEWHSAEFREELRLVYNSRYAFPYQIVTYNAVNSVRAAVPRSISQQVTFGGSSVPLIRRVAAAGRGAGAALASGFYYDTRRLSESRNETLRMAFGLDGSEMDTGYYPYRALVTSNYTSSSIGASFNRRTTIINESKSPFGAGWTLDGLEKLYPVPNDDNRYLVVSGGGAHSVFTKGVTDRPFVVGGFSTARSGAQSFPQGSSYSSARAAILAAYPQASFQGMDALTAGGLAALDILVLSPITGPTTATELTAAEQAALFAWVQAGGCALICVDHDLGRASFDAADEALLSPFGITSENSTGDIVFVSPENSPITSGVHGDVPRYVRAFGGRKVISPGNWGRSIAIDPEGGIGLVEVPENRIASGSGQVLVVTDAQVFLNGNAGIGNADHRTLLLNTMDAFLTTQEPPGADLVFRGPKGDFSRLLLKTDGTFARRHPDGTEVRFDAAGRHTATVDRNGNTIAWQYDGQGRVTARTDAGGRSATFTYNGAKIASITDPAGRTTQFEHDGAGNLTKVTLPGGPAYVMGYDERHLMIRETDPAGIEVNREYDAGGRLVRSRWPDGSTREVNATQTAALPPPAVGAGTEENPVPAVKVEDVTASFTTPRGLTIVKTNNFGQETEAMFPHGALTVDRDQNGRPTKTVLPTGEDFRRLFDRNGQEVEMLDVIFNGRQQRTYEPLFNQEASYTDEFNRTWTATFDARGNRTRVTTPAGRHNNAVFNARGQHTSLVPAFMPAGIHYSYNAAGNLESIAHGSGAAQRLTSFTRDAAGQLLSVTNAIGETTTFAWSPAGRMISITEPGARTFAIAVNPVGQLMRFTPPGRTEHQLTRDVLGRLSGYQPPAGGSAMSFGHDAWGISRVTCGGRSIHYLRNAAGQVTRTQVARGEFNSTFQNNLPRRMESPDGITEELVWKGDAVERVTVSGLTTGVLRATLDAGKRVTSFQLNSRPAIPVTYEPDGMLSTLGPLTYTHSAAEGHVIGATIGAVTEAYVCTEFGELASRFVQVNGSLVASLSRTYDKLGRAATETENIGGTAVIFAYSYDAHGRLTAVTRNGAPWYAAVWDANNCRTSLTTPDGTRAATFDSNDRLLTDGPSAFTYNAAAQLTAITGPQPLTLNCDEHGFLISAVTPAGDQIQYALTSQCRRGVKTKNGVRVQAFLWSSFLRPQAELDADNNVVSEFVYGESLNVPEYLIRSTGTYRIITDLRGSVRLVVNTATGQIAQRLDYSPWGEVLLDTAPGFQPFGFAGGLYDPDTRLVNFGVRDYDPSTGRFISRDPLLLDGGDTNFYNYCQGDPVNITDATGTAPDAENELEKKLKEKFGDTVKDEIIKRLAKKAGFASVGNMLTSNTGPQILSKATVGTFTTLWFEGFATVNGDYNPYNPATDPNQYTDYMIYHYARTGNTAVDYFDIGKAAGGTNYNRQ
jgi:RHS repeat-associated protein